MSDLGEISIQDRIIRFISGELGIPESDIDLDVNLGAYGLESVAASKLIGTLEQDYPVGLSEVLVFEFPTIAALSREIHRMSAARVS